MFSLSFSSHGSNMLIIANSSCFGKPSDKLESLCPVLFVKCCKNNIRKSYVIFSSSISIKILWKLFLCFHKCKQSRLHHLNSLQRHKTYSIRSIQEKAYQYSFMYFFIVTLGNVGICHKFETQQWINFFDSLLPSITTCLHAPFGCFI